MALPAATRAAALCRIAACASPPASAGQRHEGKLPFALAERGMVVGGHRGMGMNAVGAPPGARVGAAKERENTLLSFGRAAAHAAVAFVEFDVQVRVSLRSSGPAIPYTVALLDKIGNVVFQSASNRPVFFSTFHPDAARLMRELQSSYPVLFLTEGGTAKHNDPRRNSLEEAIRVCLEYDLHGIVSEVRGVFKNPSVVFRAQESNLAFLTYGQLNNVWEAVYIQYLMGVNGVIVDMVEEISKAVADFSRQPLSQSSLGSGVSSMDGSKHQAFSQQQLGFLLRLIPELIEQPH
ncbi:hypothetical protein PR202_ga21620 [Eleusine coracana subsp. coracana]|uniref:glycerophosphodiester phosphodiesterase n=1 Tax=Eleusine coracana subsp. coracana TaxID=191504 RepID=A0AAV5D1V9_ELECO|nr:hypothetical protein PR202_ga21620 [Eleusine coracana subsp. coracana]